MTRIRTGWRLTKASFALLRRDRSLAQFPLLATAFITLVLAATLTPGLVLAEMADRDWIVLPFMLVGGYVVTYFVVYFNVALAAAVRQSMDGRDTTLRDGLAVARERRGLIARWAALMFLFGLITRVAARLMGESVGASLVAIFLGGAAIAWSVASFFAVPVLALEGLGPRDALKRSASLVRERWGEGLVGQTAISTAVFLVAALPLLFLLNAFAALAEVDRLAGSIAGIVFAIAFIATCTIGSALSVIFRVELYRYGTEGRTPVGFDPADVTGAFAAPKAAA